MMKKTKRIFMTLLSFCLMGNVAFADEFNGFVYTINSKGNVLIKGYNGEVTDGLLIFPIIKEGVNHNVSGEFANGVANIAKVEAVDLTNVNTVSKGALAYSTEYNEDEETYVSKGFVNLKKVTIGANNVFNDGAFSGTSVSTIALASGISTVTSSMIAPFKSTLTNVDFTGVNVIGDYAFQGCTSLTGSLELLGNVTNVGKYAFANTGYTSVYISALTVLPEGAFSEARNLQSVTASKVTEIQAKAFFDCDKLYSVTTNSVSVVGASAFEDCDKITSDILEFSNLRIIGDKAFYKSSLDGTLTLSANLESVGSNAFANTGLDAVVLKSNPFMGTNAFNNSNMLTLEISDATVLDFENENTYGKVTYTRNSITANKYAGVILPFVPKENANQVFYQLGDKSNADVVEFNRVATADLEANTPYLFKNMGAKGAVTFESNGAVTIGGNTPEIITGGSWKANGVYSTQSNMASNGLLYSISGGDFTRYDQNLTVKPYRVYWTAPAKLSAIKFRAGDEDVTAIDFAEIDGFESVPATYYDLTGRRVLEPVKGNLYIVNGKKMVY